MPPPGIPTDPPASIPSRDCGNSVADPARGFGQSDQRRSGEGNITVYLKAQITDTYNHIMMVWTAEPTDNSNFSPILAACTCSSPQYDSRHS